MSIRSNTNVILSTFDATGTKAPKAVIDAKAQRDQLTAAAATIQPAPDTFAQAVADALLAHRDPCTDKAVIGAMVGQQIRQIAATDTLEAVAFDGLARALIDSADEIIEVWRKPFNVAAADLMAAFEKIGDKPLEDSASILRLGGDIADVWTKAREANQLIDKIALGWAVLGELSRRASLVSQYRVLRIADVPPRRALREFRNVKLTPWEAVTKGLPLSLATLDEFRERESATVGSADAVRQESEQDARDAAQRRYGFATA